MVTRGAAVGMAAALLCATGGAAALWTEATRPADRPNTDVTWSDTVIGSGILPPEEDQPGWNCLTMGNGDCGTLTFVADDRGLHTGYGAVQPAATDGRVYVAWPDGSVERAGIRYRELAWSVCVQTADGGDASMEACDSEYTEPGDNFDMRALRYTS